MDRIERVEVDAADDHRPLKDGVKILGTDVFVDPTAEADAKFEGELRAKIAARADSASPGLRALPVAAAPAPAPKRPARRPAARRDGATKAKKSEAVRGLLGVVRDLLLVSRS